MLERLGYDIARAKTNIGLGRVTNVAALAPPPQAQVATP